MSRLDRLAWAVGALCLLYPAGHAIAAAMVLPAVTFLVLSVFAATRAVARSAAGQTFDEAAQ